MNYEDYIIINLLWIIPAIWLIIKVIIIGIKKFKEKKIYKKYNSDYYNNRVIALIKRAYGEDFYNYYFVNERIWPYNDDIKHIIKFLKVKNKDAEDYLYKFMNNNMANDCWWIRYGINSRVNSFRKWAYEIKQTKDEIEQKLKVINEIENVIKENN